MTLKNRAHRGLNRTHDRGISNRKKPTKLQPKLPDGGTKSSAEHVSGMFVACVLEEFAQALAGGLFRELFPT